MSINGWSEIQMVVCFAFRWEFASGSTCIWVKNCLKVHFSNLWLKSTTCCQDLQSKIFVITLLSDSSTYAVLYTQCKVKGLAFVEGQPPQAFTQSPWLIYCPLWWGKYLPERWYQPHLQTRSPSQSISPLSLILSFSFFLLTVINISVQ